MTIGGTVAEHSEARPRTLRELREAAKLTQGEVAERMGVNRSRVGHIEAKDPGVRFDVLLRYTEALGGRLQIDIADLRMSLSELGTDPSLEGTRTYLGEKNDQWLQRLNAERTRGELPEKLPLQSDQPESGGDDTGGQVDQADTQRDEGDGGEGEEARAQR